MSIPPPPPGYAPNAAQMAAMKGQPVSRNFVLVTFFLFQSFKFEFFPKYFLIQE